MGRKKKEKPPQESIRVSLDQYTAKLVRLWRKKGANVSEMVRYCMMQTFPVQLTANDQVERLKTARAYKQMKFDEYRKRFEADTGKITAKIRKIEEASRTNDEGPIKDYRLD